jgi:rubrerythrin
MKQFTDLCLSNERWILFNIYQEHLRQIKKWGVQTHTAFEWLAFTLEELGELSEAISENEYRDGSAGNVVNEAFQLATLALKIAEMFETGPKTRNEIPVPLNNAKRVVYTGWHAWFCDQCIVDKINLGLVQPLSKIWEANNTPFRYTKDGSKCALCGGGEEKFQMVSAHPEMEQFIIRPGDRRQQRWAEERRLQELRDEKSKVGNETS